MKKTICLDFDGVCNLYTGWQGEDELFSPRPHLGDFISTLLNAGKRVAVFSTRPSHKLEVWFRQWFPAMADAIKTQDLFFPERKPPAECYIDDRAVRFSGSFEDILPQALNFKAHWEEMTLNEAQVNGGGGTISIDSKGKVSIGA